MQLAKKWIFVVVFVALIGGTLTALNLSALRTIAAEPAPAGDHWRDFDGHWSYWHEGDKRWYYTDGTHWYYHGATGWAIYNFDKLFGRVGFVLGGYHAPPPHEVAPPHHSIWHHL